MLPARPQTTLSDGARHPAGILTCLVREKDPAARGGEAQVGPEPHLPPALTALAMSSGPRTAAWLHGQSGRGRLWGCSVPMQTRFCAGSQSGACREVRTRLGGLGPALLPSMQTSHPRAGPHRGPCPGLSPPPCFPNCPTGAPPPPRMASSKPEDPARGHRDPGAFVHRGRERGNIVWGAQRLNRVSA